MSRTDPLPLAPTGLPLNNMAAQTNGSLRSRMSLAGPICASPSSSSSSSLATSTSSSSISFASSRSSHGFGGYSSRRTSASTSSTTSSSPSRTYQSSESNCIYTRSSRMSKPQSSPPKPQASREDQPLPSREEPAPPVKIEPSSPTLNAPAPRRRPQHLNLTASNHGNHVTHASGALTARPPIRDGQELAIACLSPGLSIHSPGRRDQLQRSAEVRERQRQMIESRNKQARGEDPGPPAEINSFGRSMNAPTNARRKRPPPNLSIAPPSHTQFANERVIQSAPINQSFTGLRSGPPPSRHIPPHGPSGLGQPGPPLHPYPAGQNNNRLPPLADVLGERGTRQPFHRSPGHSSHSNHQPPLPSPGFPPQQHHPAGDARERAGPYDSRPHETRPAFQAPREQLPSPQDGNRAINAPPPPRREYGTADEPARAYRGEEPRPAYYGGHQPPTPPSPQQMPNAAHPHPQAQPESHFRASFPKRRGRDEYERDNGSPPLGRQPPRAAPFEEQEPRFGDSAEERKRQFLWHCERAYELMHSR